MKKSLLIICFFACILNIQAQTLYALTNRGGKDGGGALVKFMPATNNLTVAKSFELYAANPYATNLIQASDGKLYGMTYLGGNGSSYNSGPAPTSFGNGTYGVIFSFDPSTSTYKMLKGFDYTNGAQPLGSLVQATNGKLYGMTSVGGSKGYGVIFSYDPSTSAYTQLKDFDFVNGAFPSGNLVQASDGKLYGMTGRGGSYGNDYGDYGYGVIFSFDPLTSTYAKLFDFDFTDGASPNGSLVLASDGKLYGMTEGGGSNGNGVIFSFDPSTSTHTKLKDFESSIDGAWPRGSLTQASDGKLYGMTPSGGTYGAGVIFSFDPSTSIYTKQADFNSTIGAVPYGSLMQASNGKLYGMTQSGGINGAGVIFSFDPPSHTYIKLKNFDGDNWNSLTPHGDGSLMQANNGKLYGMTCFGGNTSPSNLVIGNGNHGNGVIFSFDPSSFIYTRLMNLDSNSSGTWPSGTVTQARNGKLYGMATRGGSNGWGVIFSFEPDSATYTKLFDFDGINGGEPRGSLVQANDGKLYGMTPRGGSYDYGVIFSFDPSTSIYTKLIDFDGTNGFGSSGSLVQASDGKLYGMAGVIFSFDPFTSVYTRLQYIGGIPNGGFVQARDGMLYGMTSQGGNSSTGTLFSFDPLTSTVTELKNLNITEGAYPYGDLIQGNDGKLYGMTNSYGGCNCSIGGVIFSYDPSSSTYTKLKDFDGTNGDGFGPYGSLMQASDGKLYGMTGGGGSNSVGVIFSFDPSSYAYTAMKDFDGTNGALPSFGSAFVEVSDREGSGIIPAVSIVITSGTNPTCAETNVTFTATPTNGGATPFYQWKLNGANVGTNSNTYQNATLTNGAKVTCLMTSSLPGINPKTAVSNEVAIAVNAGPTLTITASPGNTFCQGTTVIFVATPVNSGTINSYQWKLNGTNVGVNSNTYENPGLSIGNKITCVLTSNASCGNQVPVTSNEITMLRAGFGSCMAIKYPNTKKSFIKTYHLRDANTDWNKVQNKPAEEVIQFAPKILSPTIPDLQVHPNPANHTAIISFYLEASAKISIDVFNIAGQQFGIIENKVLSSGNQTIPWNAEKFAAGVYFMRIRTDNYSTAKKVIVIH